MNSTYPFFLIVGPTASGKSALALDLATEFNGSILNCDSVQTYQRLNIGSAKPSPQEMSQCPHFLFDVIPPGEVLTAGDFRRIALEILAEQLPKGPVFGVGGSGFYIQALEKGMFDIPKADPQIEESVRAANAGKSSEQMHAQLEQLDPEYAEDLNPQDSYRILRALVILRDTGRKVSELRREFRPKPFAYPLGKMGLAPNREQLLPRVQIRTEKMLESGIIEEVKELIDKGYGDWPALQSVGYRECYRYLNGEISKEQLQPLIVEKTMQLSKRQRTWFKRDKDIEWLDVEDPAPRARAIVTQLVDRAR